MDGVDHNLPHRATDTLRFFGLIPTATGDQILGAASNRCLDVPSTANRTRAVPLAEVKDDLSRYLRVAAEEEILITRHGRPAGVLIGFESEDDWLDYRLFLDLPRPDTFVGFQHISFVREDGREMTSRFLNYPGGSGIRIYPRALMERLGYRLTVLLLLAFILGVVERKRPTLVAAMALGLSLGTFFLFGSLLKVPLPRGPLGF